MDIDELLNRYFEGETSSEEERELRAFFTSGNVPDRLAVYTPMFTYLEEESRKERQPDEALIPIDEDILFMLDAEKVEEKKTFTLRSVLYLVSGIAASFLLLLGLNHLLNPVDPCFCSDNYVVINGRCYTDIHKVRSMALEALQEVATPTDEYFPEVDLDEADRVIIDNQLDELRSLFDDNEFKYMLWLLVAVFCLMPCGVSAAETQKDLKIQEVFQRYGKKRNVTMVELSNEMLETYGMTRYKSITIKDDPEALRFTRQCLEADQKGARKIKEVTDDGGVVSAYYQLKGVEADINRFVLFKVSKKGVITLVYIEGDLDSDDLITLLFTKKDL